LAYLHCQVRRSRRAGLHGLALFVLKRVLQCELHDSRIARHVDLTERVLVDIRAGISPDETVRYIEPLGAKLQTLTFTDAESPGQCHIELPRTRTFDIVRPHISYGSQSGLGKRGRIHVIQTAAVGVRIFEDLVRALITREPGQGAIESAEYGEPGAGGLSVDSRQPPTRGQCMKRRIRKLGRL